MPWTTGSGDYPDICYLYMAYVFLAGLPCLISVQWLRDLLCQGGKIPNVSPLFQRRGALEEVLCEEGLGGGFPALQH